MELTARLSDLVERHPVPGAALGVWNDGKVEQAFSGTTSLENPQPVNADTLFQVGSISKTFTATAVMRLVHEGLVQLDDPVRVHVPELRLRDEQVAREVRVRHLLNHTAGWDGSVTSGAADPDLPLSAFVDAMTDLEQVTPLGVRAAYNNAAVALAGRLVERVTGKAYEAAVDSLLLEPLGLSRTYFSTDDLVPERCMVGHMAGDDGTFSVARPWRWPRGANPEGGLVSSVADQLAWAAFHLGDGTAPDGTRLLGTDALEAMRSPTAELVGDSTGEAIGLSWFLRSIDGTVIALHPGTTNGQHAELCLVPEKRLAVWVGNNGMLTGMRLNRDAVDGILDDYVGLRRVAPTPRGYDVENDGDVTGLFEGTLFRVQVNRIDDGVQMEYSFMPGAAAEMGEMPDFEPGTVGFLPGNRGDFVLLDGPFEGTMGAFTRNAEGEVEELGLGGRWHRRVPA